MRDYRKIRAWELADDLAVTIYEITRLLPREEIYGITSQIRRAATSVAANIAEGSSRNSQRDYLHFLYISRGSLSETQYFIHLCGRLGYIDSSMKEQLEVQIKQALACLHGLIRSVEGEAGKVQKLLAKTTSFIVLSLALLQTRPL